MFYRVPAEGLYVNREEIRYTPGSHHVLVFKTPYTEVPTTTLRGETVDTRGVFDCGENGATADWDVVGVAGGAQSSDGPPVSMPASRHRIQDRRRQPAARQRSLPERR